MSHRIPCTKNLPAFDTDGAKPMLEAFGPMPRETLSAMVDYGLSDADISRYFRISPDTVAALRQHYSDSDSRRMT